MPQILEHETTGAPPPNWEKEYLTRLYIQELREEKLCVCEKAEFVPAEYKRLYERPKKEFWTKRGASCYFIHTLRA
jgi:hypothetical protein